MDKYEFNIKVEQIKKLVNKNDFATAMKIADTIDWRRVRNANLLSMISQVYEKNREYQEAKEVLLLAFERAPIGKRLLYKLTELALREGSIGEAEDYYREFCDLAPDDTRQHLLRYMLLKEKKAPVDQIIHALERFITTEVDEKWMYELADLYARAGRTSDCIQLCDKMILMFGVGAYVERAMELKQRYAPLTSYQKDLIQNRDKYEEKLRAVEEGYENGTIRIQDYQNRDSSGFSAGGTAAENYSAGSGYDAGENTYMSGSAGYDQPQGGYMTGNGGYDQSQGGYTSGNNGYDQPQGGYMTGNGGYDQPQGGYMSGNGGYDQPQSGYMTGNGGYDQPQGGYMSGNAGYDQSQGGYVPGNAGYEQFRGNYAQGAGGYDQSQSSYTPETGGYDQPQGGYVSGNAGYDQSRDVFVSGGYDQPQNNYASAGGYDQPQNNYAPAGGYGQPQGNYAPAGRYDQSQSGYVPGGGYDQPQGGYMPGAEGYGPSQDGYMPGPGNYDQSQGGYMPETQEYVQPQDGYVSGSGYDHPQNQYMTETEIYGQSQGNYMTETERYGQSQGNYMSEAGGYGQPRDGYMPENGRYMQPARQYTQKENYGQPQNVYASGNGGYGSYTQGNGYYADQENDYVPGSNYGNDDGRYMEENGAYGSAEDGFYEEERLYASGNNGYVYAVDEEMMANLHQAEAEKELAAEMSKISAEDYIEQEPQSGRTKVFRDRRGMAAAKKAAEREREKETKFHDRVYTPHHLMIEAKTPEAGFEMAVEVLKKIHQKTGVNNQVIRITGSKLSRRGIFNVSDKLAGKDLIVEEAGDLRQEALEELQMLLERDETGMIVVLIDNPLQMKELHQQNPGFINLFQCIDDEGKNRNVPEETVKKWPGKETAQEPADEEERPAAEEAPYEEEEEQEEFRQEREEADQTAYIEEEETREEKKHSISDEEIIEEDPYEEDFGEGDFYPDEDEDYADGSGEEAVYDEEDGYGEEDEYEDGGEDEYEDGYEDGREEDYEDEDGCEDDYGDEDGCEDDYEDEDGYEDDYEDEDEYEDEEDYEDEDDYEDEQEYADEYESPEPADDEELDLNDFADYAVQYARDIDCNITGKSMLALYERIELMEEDGIPLTRTNAEDLIEEAADKAEKPSIGGLIKGVFSSKYDKDGLLILKEEHFI